jgi:hypothetical protein
MDDKVDTNFDTLLVRVVELAITDPNNSDANKESTGSSNKLAVAFIMSTIKVFSKKFLSPSSTLFTTNSPADFWVLNKKFQL